MKKTDVAWAAGLFEGEGCITLTRPTFQKKRGVSRYAYYRLILQMSDEDVVIRFMQIVGEGRISIVTPKITNHKIGYRWGCSDRDGVEKILNMLLPFLGERRSARARECLEALSRETQVAC